HCDPSENCSSPDSSCGAEQVKAADMVSVSILVSWITALLPSQQANLEFVWAEPKTHWGSIMIRVMSLLPVPVSYYPNRSILTARAIWRWHPMVCNFMANHALTGVISLHSSVRFSLKCMIVIPRYQFSVQTARVI